MTPPGSTADAPSPPVDFAATCQAKWGDAVQPTAADTAGHDALGCRGGDLRAVCTWLVEDLGYMFATLIAEERADNGLTLSFVFHQGSASPWVDVVVRLAPHETQVPSISEHVHAADWHEREVEDLFGIHFDGHPRLGEFILHEDWLEGVNPMRRSFDASQKAGHAENKIAWEAPTIVTAPGAFSMPIGPIFSDFAESAQFRLETVGEDVIHTIPRFFYKYRGVEKIAEGQPVDRVLLVAERFSGTSAFAHGLGFCQAVETIGGIEVPARARMLRTIFAELERLRHHAAAITGICGSTALAVANSQAALIEEELLRVSGAVAGHRYLFGVVVPGGVTRGVSDQHRRLLEVSVADAAAKLRKLHRMLRVSSSFLDRLEEVGIISNEEAITYGLTGPVARASGVDRDMRALFPYAAYDTISPVVPVELEGDGYARLRVLFREAEQSATMIRNALSILPGGSIAAHPGSVRTGVALAAVEAPLGAAFHWLRINDGGIVERYRISPPSFANWHAFPLAAENFAFQDFPIILASFGLSNAECDR
jgi:Ni,Fe-hydrogenase III large subunit/Ni,Fe-hydrogenase III component G